MLKNLKKYIDILKNGECQKRWRGKEATNIKSFYISGTLCRLLRLNLTASIKVRIAILTLLRGSELQRSKVTCPKSHRQEPLGLSIRVGLLTPISGTVLLRQSC